MSISVQQPSVDMWWHREFVLGFQVAPNKRTRENQETQVGEANQLKRGGEDQERGACVFSTLINELHRGRDIKQNRIRVRQA